MHAFKQQRDASGCARAGFAGDDGAGACRGAQATILEGVEDARLAAIAIVRGDGVVMRLCRSLQVTHGAQQQAARCDARRANEGLVEGAGDDDALVFAEAIIPHLRDGH